MNLDESSFKLNNKLIELRNFGENELHSKAYLEWMNTYEIVRTIGRAEYLRPVTRADLIQYFESLDKESTIFFAIYSQGKFIGTLKVYEINFINKSAGIGILIGDKNMWGKGIATSAISLVKSYLFNKLGLRKLHAGYFAENISMEKAFLKNGFHIEGILKEHIYMESKFIDHKLVGCLKEERNL